MATATVTQAQPSLCSKEELLSNIVKLVEKEYKSGNTSISSEKYQALLKFQEEQNKTPKRSSISPYKGKDYNFQSNSQSGSSPVPEQKKLRPPPLPRPLYLPLFYKFKAPKTTDQRAQKTRTRKAKKPWTISRIESVGLNVMENMANLLDNLHLLSKLPMFPKELNRLLQHTNSVWVVILVFLIRKTISQLLNVLRRERKVKNELEILGLNNTRLEIGQEAENSIARRYHKLLKDLKFDKMMLLLELVGNLLDLAFNAIELYSVLVPRWLMTVMNTASMAMTVYRMNKDDEYVDDDISEDII